MEAERLGTHSANFLAILGQVSTVCINNRKLFLVSRK